MVSPLPLPLLQQTLIYTLTVSLSHAHAHTPLNACTEINIYIETHNFIYIYKREERKTCKKHTHKDMRTQTGQCPDEYIYIPGVFIMIRSDITLVVKNITLATPKCRGRASCCYRCVAMSDNCFTDQRQRPTHLRQTGTIE